MMMLLLKARSSRYKLTLLLLLMLLGVCGGGGEEEGSTAIKMVFGSHWSRLSILAYLPRDRDAVRSDQEPMS